MNCVDVCRWPGNDDGPSVVGRMTSLYSFSGLAMNIDIDYKNNPLHGVSLKTLLTEIVNH